MSTSFIQEYSSGLTLSVIAHGLLLLLFSANLSSLLFEDDRYVQLPIEATIVDVSVAREQREAEQRRQQALEQQRREAEQQRQAEQARVAEQKRKEEAERQRAAEQKRQAEAERQRVAEQKRKEAEQQRIAEQKRKEEAERQRIAEEKRKAEEAERRRIAEEKRKAEEAARLAEQRRQEEMQRQFQSEIAAEEQRLAAISSGKLDQYVAIIRQRVERNWVEPASATSGIECEVSVTQIPGGEIVNVRVGRCNGDAAVVRSIEAAVYRSSPLPPPPDPSLFERNLRFMFKPEE